MMQDASPIFILTLLSRIVATSVASTEVLPRTSLFENGNESGNSSSPLVTSLEEKFINDSLRVVLSTFPTHLEKEEDEEGEAETSTAPGNPTTFNSISATPSELDTCPDIGVKVDINTLVKCQCQGNEILANGECHPYSEGTLISVQKDFFFTEEKSVANYTVSVRNVSCDPEKTFHELFTRGKFHLRPRGDMVLLKEAGTLEGQRINNYCVTHHLDDEGDLTWTMDACVPKPFVPRCCPPGQAMKNGSCQPAKTPALLTPPINVKPFSANSFEWQNIENYISPLNCKTEPVKTYKLSYKQSNLVSLADGVALGWIPLEEIGRRVYYKCPDYCVDGIENSDGTVEYFTSFCYEDPKLNHERTCGSDPCLRKCCKEGESMDVHRHGCVKDSNSTFDPSTVKDISNYKIAYGWPLCTPSSKVEGKFDIDGSGIMKLKDRKFPPTDFCVDTFLDQDSRTQSALACLQVTSAWHNARPILFPVCNVISLVFLSITIVCHLIVPELLKNGGYHQLCHAVALSFAYMSSFSINVFHTSFTRMGCFTAAILMQFGFMTTFFWLNVMCFEIWRTMRNLKLYRPSKTYPKWCFNLYAWGIPFAVCILTILMQFCAPDNIEGLIKPYIGFSRCWFQEDIGLFVYFYGPIAFLFTCNTLFLLLTYYNYRQVSWNSKMNNKVLRKLGTSTSGGIKQTAESRSRFHPENANTARPPVASSMPARQLADHVQEFWQKLLLFVLMALCWVTEILSWKIPPLELWSLTDTLNSLQGLCIFIIFLTNRNKCKQLEEKYPGPFKVARKFLKIPKRVKKLFWSDGTSLSPVSSIASAMSRSLSKSTIVSTFSSSSTSSFRVGVPSEMAKRMAVPKWKLIAALLSVLIIKMNMTHAYSRNTVLWFEVGPIARNCRDLQLQANNTSGIHTIFPYDCCPDRPVKVYCDMESDGGGWTVIQRRDDIQPREDFYRTWIEYALGFGDLAKEFWLGLDSIHALTDQTLNEIRFDLEDFEGETRWAQYKSFYVHDRGLSYKLEVNGYSGDAGDSFSLQNGQKFSTKDKDLDGVDNGKCAVSCKGAWWYLACHQSNLNEFYYAGEHNSTADGVNWFHFRGHNYSLKKTEIKIRPSY